MKFKVMVPASTSNLGSGFDALGLALKLYNEFTVETADNFSVKIEGEGKEILPANEENLFIKVYRNTMAYMELEKPISLHQLNRIPLGRGLGSSATAIVGGILTAQRVAGKKLSPSEMVDISSKFEPHMDNILPSYMGGFVVAATNSNFHYVKLDFPKELKAIVIVPEIFLSTEDSRSVLPNEFSRKDVIFNIQRVALLMGAIFKRDFSLLREAVKDRLHQPYRCKLIPSFWDVVSEGYKQGAYAVYLSGAGSCIAALSDKNFNDIGRSMCNVFESTGIDARYLVLDVDEKGATISSL